MYIPVKYSLLEIWASRQKLMSCLHSEHQIHRDPLAPKRQLALVINTIIKLIWKNIIKLKPENMAWLCN